MTTLIDVAEFTANEIYEIAQTDPVEGAGTGASYAGIGISNQPHQQLANRTAFLKHEYRQHRAASSLCGRIYRIAADQWLFADTHRR